MKKMTMEENEDAGEEERAKGGMVLTEFSSVRRVGDATPLVSQGSSGYITRVMGGAMNCPGKRAEDDTAGRLGHGADPI